MLQFYRLPHQKLPSSKVRTSAWADVYDLIKQRPSSDEKVVPQSHLEMTHTLGRSQHQTRYDPTRYCSKD